MYFEVPFIQMSIGAIINTHFDNAVNLSAKSYCQERHFRQSKEKRRVVTCGMCVVAAVCFHFLQRCFLIMPPYSGRERSD